MAPTSPGKYQSDKDTGWGLIFRLNGLWEKVDRRAEGGNYSGWEIVLDRIFANLNYREDAEITYKEQGEVEVPIDVEINDEGMQVHRLVKQKIRAAKKDMKEAVKTKDTNKFVIARSRYYDSLMFYDIWLRKFMQGLGLYLKESEKNPSGAMFGRR